MQIDQEYGGPGRWAIPTPATGKRLGDPGGVGEGEAMSDPVRTSPTVARRRLGMELRELRTRAGISIEQAADALECSISKVSRLETGLGVPRTRDVRDLIRLIGGDAVARSKELLSLAEAGRAQPWSHEYSDLLDPTLRRFFDLESGAAEELVFGGAWVPGLLQTRGYAEALFRVLSPDRPDTEIERQVRLRMGRKRLLDAERDAPLKLMAIVDESALMRSVGGPTVMRQQLEAFLTAVEDPFDNVEVFLLPFSAGMHPILAGDLTILRFDDDDDVVLSEGHTAQQWVERTGSVEEAVHIFASALNVATQGAALIDRLQELIEEFRRVESASAQPGEAARVRRG